MSDVIRVERKQGFTVLQNTMLLDKRLSLKTKGLMAVILSRPDNWRYSIAGLSAFCRCGRDAIRSALSELEKAGYLTRQQVHGERGKFAGTVYTIREISDTPAETVALEEAAPLSGFPTTDEPTTGDPTSENPTQRNKDKKKEGIKNPPIAPQGGRGALPKWKPERFAAFWDYYRQHARGEARMDAVSAWDKLKPDDALIRTMAHALTRQVESEDWRRGVGIPYAATWLNNRRWEDAPPPPKGGGEPDGPVRVVEKAVLPVW